MNPRETQWWMNHQKEGRMFTKAFVAVAVTVGMLSVARLAGIPLIYGFALSVALNLVLYGGTYLLGRIVEGQQKSTSYELALHICGPSAEPLRGNVRELDALVEARLKELAYAVGMAAIAQERGRIGEASAEVQVDLDAAVILAKGKFGIARDAATSSCGVWGKFFYNWQKMEPYASWKAKTHADI